jgi:hypothetical protein
MGSLQAYLDEMASTSRLGDIVALRAPGEAVFEQEDDPLGLLAYHTGGFTYPRQSLDILRSLIVYHLWTERCRKHFDNKHSLTVVLTQAWVATVEVGMASWKAIRS